MSDIYYRSALELVSLIKAKKVSPYELMEETLKRIDKVNPIINAFVSLRSEEALREAKDMTERIISGEDLGPLSGIPIGVKDLEDVEGMVTTFGSIAYKDNLARMDSIQVMRLKYAGALVVGKTNTPEFGFTAFTKNRLFGKTRNPWNLERTPGGSSGGSAAAVVAGMVPIATGSDGGGSIRIPASYSGCFGLKPSYGRIPVGPSPILNIYSIVVMGPLTRCVEDAALYLDCTAGYHPCDPDSLPKPDRSYLKCLKQIPSGLRIAFSPDLGYARVQKEVMVNIEKAVKCFEEMGHRVEIWKGRLPDVGEAWSNYINSDIYAKVHDELERNRSEMSRSLVATLDRVSHLSIKDQLKAQKAKTELNRILWELFDKFDLLLTPTMPTEAFSADGPPPSEVDGYPISLLGAVAFTYPFNFSGHPAASVPAGFTEKGLPVGLQIVGPRHRDYLVLQASYAYQEMRPWKDNWPTIV
jgi:aspartyl-tRNA(Asn)/glutamyl-tRNA(Gln) amidotransferase subunit A